MSKPTQYFGYKTDVLYAQNTPLLEIVDTLGTPTYAYSSDGFLDPLQTLKSGLREVNHLICFAQKSNSNIAVLRLLAEAGAGTDVVSGGELFRARIAGVPGERIVFSGVAKSTEEMTEALFFDESGIFSFNIESIPELEALNEVARFNRRRARVALRFNPNVDARTHPYISTGLKKNKFGMNRREILQILERIKSYSNIDLSGISIHIGSQLTSLSPLEDAFLKCKDLIAEMNCKLLKPISFVDIGGGLGVTYSAEKVPTIEKYCALITKHFGPRSKMNPPLRVLLEPGRLLSANSGVLLTKVIFRKTRNDKDFLIVDAGMNDLIRPALYGSHHTIIPVEKKKNLGPKRLTNVVGPVCESSDCFASDRLLPTRIKRGDVLAILSSGAYGFSMASNYNSRPRPPEVLIHQDKYTVIRKRETYEDLIRGEALI